MNNQLKVQKLLCLVICLFCIGIINAFSQEQRVTVELKNATLKQVFKSIEDQTSYRFSYRNSIVDNKNDITISKQNVVVSVVLDEVLKSKNLTYNIVSSKSIVISDKKKSEVSKEVKHVMGTVKASTGESIIGANVRILGTTIGCITDIDGNFTLDVPSDAQLSISYIGYLTQEVAVAGKSSFNIILKEDNEVLDEVVVVGYGVQKKTDLTGAVASLDNKTIAQQASANMSQALRGQIPGLSVQQNSGKAFSDATVILRGQSSIGKTVQPLVVIDGMVSDWGVLNSLNPNDIERIDVLKDASSTAIYGSRASGGVVIVTTRSGAIETKNTLSYEGTFGVKVLKHMPEMMNSNEFYQLCEDAAEYSGRPNVLGVDEEEYIKQGIDTDWIDMVTRNGFQTSHNLSLSGGGKNESHLISLGYYKSQGNLKSDAYERYSLNAKVTGKILDKITTGASAYIVYSNEKGGDGSIFATAYYSKPWGNPYNDDGSYRLFPVQQESRMVNPMLDLQNTSNEYKRFYVNSNIFLEYKPLECLVFKSNFMPAFYSNRFGTYIGENTTVNGGVAGTSTSNVSNVWKLSYVWDNTISFNKKFGNHGVNLVGLFSIENSRTEDYSSKVKDLQYDNQFWYNQAAATTILEAKSSLENYTMISYMLRANYNYKDKYLLTLTGRLDGSSKLAQGNKWGFFPSAAVSWRLSEEEFIKELDIFSNLKLRLSYGVAGNNVVDPYSSWSKLSSTLYDFDGTPAKGAAASMANKTLSWEKSYEYNLGLDIGVLENRISATVDLYHKTSKDIIMERKIPVHQGVTSLPANVSSVLNKGVELSLNTLNIQTKDFEWSTSINFAMNHNEILSLYGGYQDDKVNKWFIGHPVSVNYDYKFMGIWQLDEADEALKYTEKPGMVKRYDQNEDGKFTPDDYMILGSPFPKWTGGITNNFRYKDFDLSFFIYTRQGVHVLSGFHNDYTNMTNYDARYNVSTIVDYWTPENPSNRWWAPSTSGGTYTAYVDASFWRVGNITLGYNLNKNLLKSLKLSNCRVYCSINNPFLFTKYEGWDPEWATAGAGDIPMSNTTYMCGINVTF